MRIGELAKRAGVSVQAIRFYERRRLMRTPRRTATGYRIYSEQDLENVTLIKKMDCLRETSKLGEKKLQSMNEQIRSAIQIRDELMEALDQIRAALNARTRQKASSDHAESSRPPASAVS
jgi:DNA-binding transcriptional MerR regulator